MKRKKSKRLQATIWEETQERLEEEYLQALKNALSEWDSQNDDKAFGDLQDHIFHHA